MKLIELLLNCYLILHLRFKGVTFDLQYTDLLNLIVNHDSVRDLLRELIHGVMYPRVDFMADESCYGQLCFRRINRCI